MFLALRLLLAAVFVVAGIAKLADLPGSRRAAHQFGIPERLSKSLGTLLPFTELAIAGALLFVETAWWGAIGALVLLSLFIIGIAVNLARGKRPDCHCFGQLHSAPIGWQTLVRNGLLFILAALIVLQGPQNVGPSISSYLAALPGGQLIGLVFAVVVLGLVALEGWFILHLMQQKWKTLVAHGHFGDSTYQQHGLPPIFRSKCNLSGALDRATVINGGVQTLAVIKSLNEIKQVLTGCLFGVVYQPLNRF